MLYWILGDMPRSHYHDRVQLTVEFSREVAIHTKLSISKYELQDRTGGLLGYFLSNPITGEKSDLALEFYHVSITYHHDDGIGTFEDS